MRSSLLCFELWLWIETHLLVWVCLGRRLLAEEGVLGQLLLQVHGINGCLLGARHFIWQKPQKAFISVFVACLQIMTLFLCLLMYNAFLLSTWERVRGGVVGESCRFWCWWESPAFRMRGITLSCPAWISMATVGWDVFTPTQHKKTVSLKTQLGTKQVANAEIQDPSYPAHNFKICPERTEQRVLITTLCVTQSLRAALGAERGGSWVVVVERGGQRRRELDVGQIGKRAASVVGCWFHRSGQLLFWRRENAAEKQMGAVNSPAMTCSIYSVMK